MKRIPSTLGVAALLLLAVPTARAQVSDTSRQSFEIAVEPKAVLTSPFGTLESIRGSTPCSNTFAGALGVNPSMGIRFTWLVDARELSNLSFLALRGLSLSSAWDDISTRYVSSPDNAFEAYDPTVNRYVAVNTRHGADFTVQSVRGAIEAEFCLGPSMLLRIGPSLAGILSALATEHEEIVSPSNATFLDKTQERDIPEGTGNVNDATVRIGMGASVAYRLPLGSSFYFEPAVGIDFPLSTIQPSWSPVLVRGGIALGRWGRITPTVVVPPPPPPPPPPSTPPTVPFAAALSVEVVGRVEQISFRRQIVAKYIPILPTVFFDRDDSTLKRSYQSTGAFREEDLPPNAEQAHRRTLDIFGRRMQLAPGSRVTITGTTSGDESARPELARARAEAVADYLSTRWHLQPDRLIVRSRIDPSNPSNPANAEGLAENRRVELEFSQDGIYRPVQLRTVEPITDPPYIEFSTRASSPSTIRNWELGIEADGAELTVLKGDGVPPEVIRWVLSLDQRERVIDTRKTTFRLAVYDSIGRTVAIEDRPLPVRIDTTVSVASLDRQPDSRADFLLVTFDFDRAELTRRGREELRTILGRLKSDSRVEVIGYTDPIGDEAHNRALALARARNVAQQIPTGVPSTFRGAFPDEAPYSGGTAEGRFLSRTVRVVIENPR